MGEELSKQQKYIELKKIGQDANKENPKEFVAYSPIKVTNELLVTESKSDPDKEYKKHKRFII